MGSQRGSISALKLATCLHYHDPLLKADLFTQRKNMQKREISKIAPKISKTAPGKTEVI